VRDTFLKILTIDEKNILHLMLEDKDSGYRAKIILLKDEGYTVPQIRKITNHHDNNIRKWIHRFNEKGIDGIMLKKHTHKQHKFDNNLEEKIVDIEHLQIQDLLIWDFLRGHYVFLLVLLCLT
jgi:transposase